MGRRAGFYNNKAVKGKEKSHAGVVSLGKQQLLPPCYFSLISSKPLNVPSRSSEQHSKQKTTRTRIDTEDSCDASGDYGVVTHCNAQSATEKQFYKLE